MLLLQSVKEFIYCIELKIGIKIKVNLKWLGLLLNSKFL